MRRRYVYRDGLGVISASEANLHDYKRFNYGVIEDTMPDTYNHADGKIYNSKSQYRRALKATGHIEVGNEWKDPEKRINKPSLSEIREYDRHLDTAIDKALAHYGIE